MAAKKKYKGKGNKRAQRQRRRERRHLQPAYRQDEYMLIDGNITHYPVAYCKRKRGYLTVGLLQVHNCAGIECRSLAGVDDV